MKKIAIEEHFWTKDYLNYLRSRKEYPKVETVEDAEHNNIELYWRSLSVKSPLQPQLRSSLLDLSEGRIKAMDECGIDLQVLSLAIPGVEPLEAADAIAIARSTNDELAGVIKRYPRRLAGFAALPAQQPDVAAYELERTVKELGLKGGLINSHVRGEYLDDEKYWVIFEVAEKLDVPIFLHPRMPSPDMEKPFITYPALTGSIWGFAAETGLHVMRLISSGVFDKYPHLKIILGHLGEALPFWQWRLDNRWLREGLGLDPRLKKLQKKPSQYIKDNIFVNISGMFWEPALLCTYSALGAEKILFAVDYPYESNREAVDFMDLAPISDNDKEKIYHQNAEAIMGL
jgi:5-carboxyvanillate decarboxylase